MVRRGSVDLGGGLEVDLAPAELYAPDLHFHKEVMSEAAIASNLDMMVRTAIEHGNTTGLGSLLVLILDEASSLNSGPLNMFASAGLRRLARVENAYGSGERGDGETANSSTLKILSCGRAATSAGALTASSSSVITRSIPLSCKR